jgi:hypothetical protein
MAPGKVKVSARLWETTRVSNRDVPTSIRGQMETMRCTHMKTVHLPTPMTRAGGVTPTRGVHAAQTSMADATLTVGANEEQIMAVVLAATVVLTKKWSNKLEVTSATISAPI